MQEYYALFPHRRKKMEGGRVNSLLLDEYPLVLLPSLALEYGLLEAIILQQLHFWLQRSTHEHGGKRWVYKTYDEWAEEIPFVSKRTIRRTIRSLEEAGIIETGNFNEKAYDNTKWYTICYERLYGQNDHQPSGHADHHPSGHADHTNTIDYNNIDHNNNISSKNASLARGDEIEEFHRYYCEVWKDVFPRGPKLTQGRRKKIQARLRTYTLDELKKACDNLHASKWHRGENPNGQAYGTIDFLIRNDEQIDKWLQIKTTDPPYTAKKQNTLSEDELERRRRWALENDS